MKTIAITALLATSAVATAQSNLQEVQDIYAKFGQGDVPGILAKLTENVKWINGANPAIVPYGGTRHGISGAAEFFQLLGQNAQITTFVPSNFQATDNRVSNDLLVEGTVLSTGKKFRDNQVFTFEFNADGKVTKWESSGSFASMEAAFAK